MSPQHAFVWWQNENEVFFRKTPTSPWVPFRAKFWPLGRLFHPSRPLAWSLPGIIHVAPIHEAPINAATHVHNDQDKSPHIYRPLVESAYQKINFLISQPKHMLWVLKRTVSMRRLFWAPKTYVQTDGLESINNFTLKNSVYLEKVFSKPVHKGLLLFVFCIVA